MTGRAGPATPPIEAARRLGRRHRDRRSAILAALLVLPARQAPAGRAWWTRGRAHPAPLRGVPRAPLLQPDDRSLLPRERPGHRRLSPRRRAPRLRRDAGRLPGAAAPPHARHLAPGVAAVHRRVLVDPPLRSRRLRHPGLPGAGGSTSRPSTGCTGSSSRSTLNLYPLVFLVMLSGLRTLDHSLEEAAAGLGSRRWRVFRTVTVPVLLPSILGGALLVFLTAFADFGAPMIIGEGYQVLPTIVYSLFVDEMGGSPSMASTAATLLVLCTTDPAARPVVADRAAALRDEPAARPRRGPGRGRSSGRSSPLRLPRRRPVAGPGRGGGRHLLLRGAGPGALPAVQPGELPGGPVHRARGHRQQLHAVRRLHGARRRSWGP